MRSLRLRTLLAVLTALGLLAFSPPASADSWEDFLDAQDDLVALTALHGMLSPYGEFVAEDEGTWDVGQCNMPEPLGTTAAAAAIDTQLSALQVQLELAEGHLDDAHAALQVSDWATADYHIALAEVVLDDAYDVDAEALVVEFLERTLPHGAAMQPVRYAIPLHELDNVQWLTQAEIDVLMDDVPVSNTVVTQAMSAFLAEHSTVPMRGQLAHRDGVVIRDPLVIDLGSGWGLNQFVDGSAGGALPYETGQLHDVRIGDIAWLPSGTVMEFPTLDGNFSGGGCELPFIPITPQPGADAPTCGCTQMCTGFGGFLGSLILTGSLGLQGGGFYPNPDCLLINTIFTHFRTRDTLETIHIDVLESTPEGFRDALLQWEVANLADFRASIEDVDPQLFDDLGTLLNDLGTPPDPLAPHHISYLSAPTGGSGCGGGPPGGGGGGGGGTWPGADPVCENTCAIDRPQCGSITPGSLPGNGCGRVLLDPMGSCMASLTCDPNDIGGLTGYGHIAPDGFWETMKGTQGCWNFAVGGDPQDIASCASTNPSHQETMTQLCDAGSPFCSGTVICPGDGTTGATCRVCVGTTCVPVNPRAPGVYTEDPGTGEQTWLSAGGSVTAHCFSTTSDDEGYRDCIRHFMELYVQLGRCASYEIDGYTGVCIQGDPSNLEGGTTPLVEGRPDPAPNPPPQPGPAPRGRSRSGGGTGASGGNSGAASDQQVDLAGAGDPVMLNTGGLMMSATDLHSHGDPHFAVSMHRRYNSHGGQVGVLGRNWTSIVDERLTIPVAQSGGRASQQRVPPLCTMWPGATLCLLHHDGGGGTTLYVWDQSREIFVPETGNAGVIVTVSDPAPLLGMSSGLKGLMYAHRAPDGATTLFDLRGTKRARIDATGNVTRFRPGGDGRIEQIVTPDGFIIELVYGLWGLLESAHSEMGTVFYSYGLNVEVEGELAALEALLDPEEEAAILNPNHEQSQYRRRLASPWDLRELIDALATAAGAHWSNPTITPDSPYTYSLFDSPGIPAEAKRVFARLEEVRFEPPGHGSEARITRYEYDLPPPIDIQANTPDIQRCIDNQLAHQGDTGQCGTETAVSRDCASIVMRTISNQPFEHSYISRVSRREEGSSAAGEMVVGTVVDGWIIELENAWGWRDDRTAQVIVQRYGPSIDWDPVQAVNASANAASDSVSNAQPSWWTGSAVVEVSGVGSLAAMQSDSPVIEFRYLPVRELDTEEKSLFGTLANAVSTANTRMGLVDRAEFRPAGQGGPPAGIGLAYQRRCDLIRSASPAYELTGHGLTATRFASVGSGQAAIQEVLEVARGLRTQNANLVCDVALVHNGNGTVRVVGLNAYGVALIDIEDAEAQAPSINAQVVNGDGYSEVELLANGVVRYLSRLGGLEEHPLRRGLVVYELMQPRATMGEFAWLPGVFTGLLDEVPPVVRTMDYEPMANRILVSTLNDHYEVEHIYEYQRSESALNVVKTYLELFGFTSEDDVLPPHRPEADQTGQGHFAGFRPLPVRRIETDESITVTHQMGWNVYGQMVLRSGPGVGEVAAAYGDRSASAELPSCPSVPSLCNVAIPLLTSDWGTDPSLAALATQGGSVVQRSWVDTNPVAGQVPAPSMTTRLETTHYNNRMLPEQVVSEPGGTTFIEWSAFGEIEGITTPIEGITTTTEVTYHFDRDGRGRQVRMHRSAEGNNPSMELLHRTVRSPTGVPLMECVSTDLSCDACVASIVSSPQSFFPSECQGAQTRLTRIGRDGRGRVTGVVGPDGMVSLASWTGAGQILSSRQFAIGSTTADRHVEWAYGDYGDVRTVTQVASVGAAPAESIVTHVAEDGFGRVAATRLGLDGPWQVTLEHPAPSSWPYRYTAEYFGGWEGGSEVLYSRTDTYRSDGGRPLVQLTWDAEEETSATLVAASGVSDGLLTSPSHPLLGGGTIEDLRGHGFSWDAETGNLDMLSSSDRSTVLLEWTAAGMLASEQLWSVDTNWEHDELLHSSVRAWEPNGSAWTLRTSTTTPGGMDVLEEVEHDSHGRPISFWSMDADGQMTSSYREYDALHRVVTGTDEQGTGWSLEYDGFGQPLSWTSNSEAGATGLDDVQKTWTYDVMGRVLSHVDELGRTFTWTYNTRGELISESRPWASNWRTYTYDGLGRPVKIERHGEHDVEITYETNGGGVGQISFVEFSDQSVPEAWMGFQYGGSGRLSGAAVFGQDGAVGTSITRSGSGHPVSEQTVVSIDSTYVMDTTTTWTLDSEQRPVFWHSDRGVSQEIDWGSANRVAEVRQCHGATAGAGCDFASHAPVAGWIRDWSGLFMHAIFADVGGTPSTIMGRVHDARGRISHMGHLVDNDLVAEHRQVWGEDDRVRLETLIALTPEHDHASITTDWRGISRAYAYSGQGFLDEAYEWEWYSDLTTAPPSFTDVQAVSTPWDFNSSVVQPWTGHSPFLVEYGRSAAGTAATEYADMALTWSSTPMSTGSQAWTLPEAFSNGFGAHDLDWDTAGRLTELEPQWSAYTTTIDWCPTGTPRSLESWDGSTLVSEEVRLHDVFGRNVVRVVDGTVVERVWVGDQLVGEWTECGSRILMPDVELDRVMGWEVEWDIDCGVLEGEDPSVLDIDPDVLSGSGSVVSGVFQLLQDLDGSPMLVLDEDGTPVEFLRYDAYGGFERVSQVDQSTVSQCVSSAAGGCRSIHGNLIGYKGSLYHGWTNLNEMRHRLYSSDLRQFLSMDPLGLIDSVDEWLFVRGDPINFSDRFGLAAEHARTPWGGPAWDPLVESSPETRAMEQDVWGSPGGAGSPGGFEPAVRPLPSGPRKAGPAIVHASNPGHSARDEAWLRAFESPRGMRDLPYSDQAAYVLSDGGLLLQLMDFLGLSVRQGREWGGWLVHVRRTGEIRAVAARPGKGHSVTMEHPPPFSIGGHRVFGSWHTHWDSELGTAHIPSTRDRDSSISRGSTRGPMLGVVAHVETRDRESGEVFPSGVFAYAGFVFTTRSQPMDKQEARNVQGDRAVQEEIFRQIRGEP